GFVGCDCPVDNPVRSGRTVKRWRFHFRRAEHRHAVSILRPLTTLVLTGPKRREWGFWQYGIWVQWENWFRQRGLPPCADEEQQNGMEANQTTEERQPAAAGSRPHDPGPGM